jgi:hypothetical protein
VCQNLLHNTSMCILTIWRRMATIVVAQRAQVRKNFVHSRWVNCCGLLKHLDTWRSGFYSRARIYPLHPLNPFTNTDITIATYELRIFSQLTNTVLTQRVFLLSLALEFTVCWNINTGLQNKNSFFTREISGVLYPYKCNVQISEILTNIDVYSHRRPHRRASCSAGVIYRGCGVVTCNT